MNESLSLSLSRVGASALKARKALYIENWHRRMSLMSKKYLKDSFGLLCIAEIGDYYKGFKKTLDNLN